MSLIYLMMFSRLTLSTLMGRYTLQGTTCSFRIQERCRMSSWQKYRKWWLVSILILRGMMDFHCTRKRLKIQKGYYVKDVHVKDYDSRCCLDASSYLDILNPEMRSWWDDKFSLSNYKGSTPIVVHMEWYEWTFCIQLFRCMLLFSQAPIICLEFSI